MSNWVTQWVAFCPVTTHPLQVHCKSFACYSGLISFAEMPLKNEKLFPRSHQLKGALPYQTSVDVRPILTVWGFGEAKILKKKGVFELDIKFIRKYIYIKGLVRRQNDENLGICYLLIITLKGRLVFELLIKFNIISTQCCLMNVPYPFEIDVNQRQWVFWSQTWFLVCLFLFFFLFFYISIFL